MDDEKEDDKEEGSSSRDSRSFCWSHMLKKLTRKRRLSLKGNEAKMDIERLYPSRTFMIKKPLNL
jgi:hypothetical protein